MKYQDFTECIGRAYDWANEKLQNLILNDYKLLEVLKSMKGYYFMEYGDLFVHFMESAQSELSSNFEGNERKSKVSIEKLQNLFELLIRTSSANSDPYKEEIECKLDTEIIYKKIQKIKILESDKFKSHPGEKSLAISNSKYFHHFSLDYNCSFPLNLIVNKKNLSKYQVIFRYLFRFRFLERQLLDLWKTLMGTKLINPISFRKASMITK